MSGFFSLFNLQRYKRNKFKIPFAFRELKTPDQKLFDGIYGIFIRK